MQSNKLRELFIDFFNSKNHEIVSASPVVIKDDPTLMFTNAGMNQFKDIFLGIKPPKYTRVVNSQRCLRVSGKHNDLEQVGHDSYHHTLFEMLGSWSFGDYFKEEAIKFSWEFLTKICKLDKDRLYVTIFEGSEDENLDKDIDSYKAWSQLISEDRIIFSSKADNFWEMGDSGPCGPCSEIHYDNRVNVERKNIDGKSLVNTDHDQVIEIWNLVFIQYNRYTTGKLKALKDKHVDTGMGFERLAMIMQGVNSNYETDIFLPIINKIAEISSIKYGDKSKQDIAMRVISDHIRAIVFSIIDGQLPSNVKAGYVIRRILRRAIRYGYNFLNFRTPFLYKLIPVLELQFSEITSHKELLVKVIKEEEESFLRTLEGGLKRINDLIVNSKGSISGEDVFELYDTYGFPVDLTSLILSENQINFNMNDFNKALKEQRKRSKKASKLVAEDWVVLHDDEHQEFVGYNNLEVDVKITKYRKVISNQDQKYHLVFNVTPFYPEGGGQVGDIGFISNQTEKIKILDTKKENKLIIHLTENLPSQISKNFTASVDIEHRKQCSRNHSATHLLHQSLLNILGDHISQRGSLVDSKNLRFDFSHFSKITDQEIKKIELFINLKILANIQLEEHNNLPLSKAQKLGAIMLFGEKYEDVVRMIQFGDSKELCGGTHVSFTGEIGLFKIISEGSVSSGIRRIHAITGNATLEYLEILQQFKFKTEKMISKISVAGKSTMEKLQNVVLENKYLNKKIKLLKEEKYNYLKSDCLQKTDLINGVRFLAIELDDGDSEDIKQFAFMFKNEENLVVILALKKDNKALLNVVFTDDLIKKGLDASSLINVISKDIRGGGGGQKHYATAGGKNVDGISLAFENARKYISNYKF